MAKTVKDPVCGMEIRTDRAAASEEHQGELVYFCSRACHETFLEEPHRWAHPADSFHHDHH